MALEAGFLDCSTEIVTVLPASTVSFYGAFTPATSTGTEFRAYLDMTPHKVFNTQGVEVIASGTIYIFSSSAAIGLQDVVELSDGRKPELLRVEPLRDDEGQHHVEVSFR